MSKTYQYFFETEPDMHQWLQCHVAAFETGGIVFLEGHLGAGKTSFSRGLLRAFGFQGAVKSPTYTLMEHYCLPHIQVCHFDLYRMADPEELAYLGAEDFLDDGALWLVEWPEKGQGFLPDVDLVVQLSRLETREGRQISITAHSLHGENLISVLQG